MADAPARDAARTKERIVLAARPHFALHGFDRARVRAIAADAGVAPNLITRYFGGKRGLFQASTEVDLEVESVLEGPCDQLGQRIAAHVVSRWERGPGNDPLVTMLRAAGSDPVAAAHTAEFFRVQASAPLAKVLGGSDATERVAAVGAFICGTVMQRYVLPSGPIAAATPERLVAWMAGVLQSMLTGPAPPPLD